MPEQSTRVAVALLALRLAATWGCDDDDDRGASGGDGDADGDTDSEIDTCADAACDCYPEGPYKWFEGSVVSPVDFPAIHGSGGAETTLDMCEAHLGGGQVKSLVFVVGANT